MRDTPLVRPDLLLLPLDIWPTGVLVVLGADPRRTALRDHYGAIVAEYVHPDPEPGPEAVSGDENANDPASIIGTSVVADLRRGPGLAQPPSQRARGKASCEANAAPPPTVSGRALHWVRGRLRPLRRRVRGLSGGRI